MYFMSVESHSMDRIFVRQDTKYFRDECIAIINVSFISNIYLLNTHLTSRYDYGISVRFFMRSVLKIELNTMCLTDHHYGLFLKLRN